MGEGLTVHGVSQEGDAIERREEKLGIIANFIHS